MKFTGHIDISKPKSTVADYFINPNYLGEYQDGFVSKKLKEGTANQEGAISQMFYKYGKREMELTETVISNNLPDSFVGHYHHKHMDNYMRCTFKEIDENNTRYEYEFEYTRINWFMPKLMAILFPSMYRKQGEKWMRQFKEFVERQ
ncbi:MAG: SRPBCC family protein [Bacteroidia bacterium]